MTMKKSASQIKKETIKSIVEKITSTEEYKAEKKYWQQKEKAYKILMDLKRKLVFSPSTHSTLAVKIEHVYKHSSMPERYPEHFKNAKIYNLFIKSVLDEERKNRPRHWDNQWDSPRKKFEFKISKTSFILYPDYQGFNKFLTNLKALPDKRFV